MIETQEPGVRIIDKTGPLANPGRSRSLHPVHGGDPADLRPPHCRRTTKTPSRTIRASTRCAAKMQVRENTTFTQDYYAADKRYIGNAVQVFFRDGTSTRARRGRLSHRPSQAPRRGHAGAGEEVRGVGRRALHAEADRIDQGAVRGPRASSSRCRCRSSWPGWSRIKNKQLAVADRIGSGASGMSATFQHVA